MANSDDDSNETNPHYLAILSVRSNLCQEAANAKHATNQAVQNLKQSKSRKMVRPKIRPEEQTNLIEINDNITNGLIQSQKDTKDLLISFAPPSLRAMKVSIQMWLLKSLQTRRGQRR